MDPGLARKRLPRAILPCPFETKKLPCLEVYKEATAQTTPSTDTGRFALKARHKRRERICPPKKAHDQGDTGSQVCSRGQSGHFAEKRFVCGSVRLDDPRACAPVSWAEGELFGSTWSPGARDRAVQNRKRSAFQRERADSHRKHPARSQASSQPGRSIGPETQAPCSSSLPWSRFTSQASPETAASTGCSSSSGRGCSDLPKKATLPPPWPENASWRAYSQDTWAFLAQEAREALPVLRDLALHFQNPGSAADAVGFVPTNYVKAMGRDPERARRFTQMLYEIHEPIAEELAVRLDLRGVERFMDLGGGSGVVSLALLRRSCLVSLLFFPPGLSLFGGLVRIWEHNVRSCVLAHDRKQAGRR